jgi:hypothetical protein
MVGIPPPGIAPPALVPGEAPPAPPAPLPPLVTHDASATTTSAAKAARMSEREIKKEEAGRAMDHRGPAPR